jgi:NTP pyrophosphatase (non-canonical NTP hydrolase)
MKNHVMTDAAVERYACLAEEAGEIVQVIGKILRHGPSSASPFDPDQVTNKELLEREVGDLLHWVGVLAAHGDVDTRKVETHQRAKPDKCRPYLHFEENKA